MNKRGTAFGVFNAVYGVAWFAGSLTLGALYDLNLGVLVAVSLVCQLAALPLFLGAFRKAAA